MATGSARRAILIAGPTASGKSGLALSRARETGGVVVNADAMQVYDGLRVLTARPSAADMGGIPHLLYGVVPPETRFSTGDWLGAVRQILAESDGRPLIFAGGTGLYFDALLNGFAEVPPVPPEIVAEVRAEVEALDGAGRARLIGERDPAMARRLKAPDPQRVMRALAVLRATGRSLTEFQDAARRGLLEGYETEKIVLNPDRKVLAERIAHRFSGMIETGAIEEVQALLARGLDPHLPVMKAIGVREIGGWLAGETGRDEAIEQAVIATRQYGKRQRTWLRNRMGDWRWIDPTGVSG